MAYKVTQLWTYPVKSLGGIAVSEARVLPKGLETDRRWMLVDEQNMFLTQRVHHRLALFRPTWYKNRLRISYNNDHIDVPPTTNGTSIRAAIWNDVVSVVETDESVSKWFSDRLGIVCRLVAFPEENPRNVDPRYNLGGNHVSLADAYPLLIIGQGSLDDLNSRMEIPVPMNRFRPNIVFAGGAPFVEDQWKEFRVGDNEFAAVKPCARCALPTVDQDTGVMGKEPLATLNKYRKQDGKVLFGMNLIPIDHKTIYVGDEITF